MKNFFIICFFVMSAISSGCALAADTSGWGENSDVFNKGFSEQKQVSESEFKKTVDQIKERGLSKKQKKIKNQIQPNAPAADEEHLKMFAESQDPDNDLSQTLTVMIPVKAHSKDGTYILPGYYKLSCRKIADNKYVLDLSQGTQRILTVEANETKEDLEQDTIQFCNAEVIQGGRVRLMYGSINLNLVGYIYYD